MVSFKYAVDVVDVVQFVQFVQFVRLPQTRFAASPPALAAQGLAAARLS